MRAPILPLALFVTLSGIPAAQAAVTVVGQEVGGDVVFSGGGTLNLSALTLDSSPAGFAFVQADAPAVVFGTGVYDAYTSGAIVSPGPMGPGTSDFIPASFPEDHFGLIEGPSGGVSLLVPTGYSSGDPLNGSLTIESTDLATMGFDPGTYVWSWGADATADTFTVIIVPEPSTACLGLAGLSGLLLCRRRASR